MGSFEPTENTSIVASIPYPELAITKLFLHARIVATNVEAFTPSRRLNRAIAGVLMRRSSPSGVAARLDRGSDLSANGATEIAPASETIRLASRLLPRSASLRSLAVSQKKAFDRSVARRLKGMSPGIVVGMPEASLETFSAAIGWTRVFHQVDAHPISHNESLLEHYSRSRLGNELRNVRQIQRIQAEIDASDVVLVPSKRVEAQMRHNGAERIIRVPYGVDFSLFKPYKAAENQKLTALYVGQISLRKGIPFLIEAFRRSSRNLVMVGPLVDESLVAQLPPNVVYAGATSTASLPRLMAASDFFVFPSIEDNFALVLAEAAAAGLRIVTTTSVGAIDVLGVESLAGVVPPGNSAALAEAVDTIEREDYEARQARARLVRSNGRILSWAEYSESVLASIRTQRMDLNERASGGAA